MTNSEANTAKGALEQAINTLQERIYREIGELEGNRDIDSQTSEQRLKTLNSHVKALQSIEDMARGLREQRDGGSEKPIDVVAFRRDLEKQIERLVEQEAAARLPTGTAADGDGAAEA